MNLLTRPWPPLVCLAALASTSCAFVRFEPSPYQAFEIVAVYSAQEDMTFLSWSLSRDADPGSAVFEILDDRGWQRLDLTAAPFPAAPQASRRSWTFQFQVEGRYEPPEGGLRTLYEGVALPGEDPTFQVVDVTHGLDPIAVERNTALRLDRSDWFAEHGVPLVRDFQWGLRPSSCESVATGAWAEATPEVSLPDGWTERSACIEVRPWRRDGGQGVAARAALNPSAETFLGDPAVYVPTRSSHITLYGVLFDLAVPDADRCEQVVSAIGEMIDGAVLAADPRATRIGRYEAGATRCPRVAPDSFPVAQMLSDAFDRERELGASPSSIAWFVVTNRTTPSVSFDEALAALAEGSLDVVADPAFFFPISTGPISTADTTFAIVYRPIEDPLFVDDLYANTRIALPAATMDHDLETAIELAPVARSAAPAWGRVCQSAPSISDIRVGGMSADPRLFAWPEDDDVSYVVDLGVQRGVAAIDYIDPESLVRIEVCERFCDGPVLAVDDRRIESWEAASRCARLP